MKMSMIRRIWCVVPLLALFVFLSSPTVRGATIQERHNVPHLSSFVPALAGTITEYPLPKINSQPAYITGGPDGNLWFTESLTNLIGMITPSGKISEYPVGGSSSPEGITHGPDGNLWFTEFAGNNIAKITPD